MSTTDLFKKHYEACNLEETSIYGHLSKEELVIEADYLHQSLVNILQYIKNGGKDTDRILGEVMDGLYESRI